MKFKIIRTSDCLSENDTNIKLEINTLEELIKFKEETGEEIILRGEPESPVLEIYDYYRE